MNFHKSKGKEFDGVIVVERKFRGEFFNESWEATIPRGPSRPSCGDHAREREGANVAAFEPLETTCAVNSIVIGVQVRARVMGFTVQCPCRSRVPCRLCVLIIRPS
jgi:hypothetical protein